MAVKKNHFVVSLKSHFILFFLAAAFFALLFLWPHAAAQNKSPGKCLSEKGAIMYGSDSCENCTNQKKLFGGDFINVNYVNCEFSYDECRKKGISVYPVWVLNNQILVGTQTLTALSKFAGCEDKE